MYPLLEELYLGRTLLQGTLPKEWGMLPAVRFIMLQNNDITGTIPAEWANITSLNGLFLENTNLSGSASFLCGDNLGPTFMCEDCGLKVDLEEVDCSCCAEPER